MNGDGRMDLVSGNAWSFTVSVLLGKSDGGFEAPLHYPSGARVGALTDLAPVALADLNADGRLDVVIANEYNNNVSVLLGGCQ
jgi:hypothetical protein